MVLFNNTQCFKIFFVSAACELERWIFFEIIFITKTFKNTGNIIACFKGIIRMLYDGFVENFPKIHDQFFNFLYGSKMIFVKKMYKVFTNIHNAVENIRPIPNRNLLDVTKTAEIC